MKENKSSESVKPVPPNPKIEYKGDDLLTIEVLGCFTNSVDLIRSCFYVEGENWWVMGNSFAQELNVFGHIFESFTKHWVERLSSTAID